MYKDPPQDDDQRKMMMVKVRCDKHETINVVVIRSTVTKNEKIFLVRLGNDDPSRGFVKKKNSLPCCVVLLPALLRSPFFPLLSCDDPFCIFVLRRKLKE